MHLDASKIEVVLAGKHIDLDLDVVRRYLNLDRSKPSLSFYTKLVMLWIHN